ncbi:MAG: hypothetical protein HYY50_04360 [Candidatus Kerfeldbacteria bacterium]|nr:hypothetical protein [Candidatus Kerfeldbacteria bacterium]
MAIVTQRVSFAVVIALLLGWGIMLLLIFQASNEILGAQVDETAPPPLPRGVRLLLRVDKDVYQPGEPVLISLRNNSPVKIWLAERADGCATSWWRLEQVEDDASAAVNLTGQTCEAASFGSAEFPRHDLKTAQWDGLIRVNQLGEVYGQAPTGVYRIAVPFLRGRQVDEHDWLLPDARYVYSPQFTMQ